jgi:hypothetical protein
LLTQLKAEELGPFTVPRAAIYRKRDQLNPRIPLISRNESEATQLQPEAGTFAPRRRTMVHDVAGWQPGPRANSRYFRLLSKRCPKPGKSGDFKILLEEGSELVLDMTRKYV